MISFFTDFASIFWFYLTRGLLDSIQILPITYTKPLKYKINLCLQIQDTGIRDMILHMIQLDPKKRLPCRSYLQKYESVVFPFYFSKFLHKFFSDIVPLDSDARVRVIQVCSNLSFSTTVQQSF
jgi:hypothetical protein